MDHMQSGAKLGAIPESRPDNLPLRQTAPNAMQGALTLVVFEVADQRREHRIPLVSARPALGTLTNVRGIPRIDDPDFVGVGALINRNRHHGTPLSALK